MEAAEGDGWDPMPRWRNWPWVGGSFPFLVSRIEGSEVGGSVNKFI